VFYNHFKLLSAFVLHIKIGNKIIIIKNLREALKNFNSHSYETAFLSSIVMYTIKEIHLPYDSRSSRGFFPKYVDRPDILVEGRSQWTSVYPLDNRLPPSCSRSLPSGKLKLPLSIELHDTSPVRVRFSCLRHL